MHLITNFFFHYTSTPNFISTSSIFLILILYYDLLIEQFIFINPRFLIFHSLIQQRPLSLNVVCFIDSYICHLVRCSFVSLILFDFKASR